MVLDFVESRVANPVKLADWSDVSEGQTVVCGCCGWSGPLGDGAVSCTGEARAYACAQCAMPLVVRVYPRLISWPASCPSVGRSDIERFVANL